MVLGEGLLTPAELPAPAVRELFVLENKRCQNNNNNDDKVQQDIHFHIYSGKRLGFGRSARHDGR